MVQGGLMGEVVKLYPHGRAEDPDNVLKAAVGVYESCVVLGWTADGEHLDARASTNLTEPQLVYLLDLFRHKLLNGDYDED